MNRWLMPPIFSETDNTNFPSPRQRHTACNFGIYIYNFIKNIFFNL